MIFHVPCLPHTLPTKDYAHCAYSQKELNYKVMMERLGHTVHLYESDEPFAPSDNLTLAWNPTAPIWQRQNARMIEMIRERMQPRDFLCLIGGDCQRPIAEAIPELLTVEFGVGYYGVFAKHCVFESYFHMANVYGRKGWDNGRFFDAVIPNYYDLDDFPVSLTADDYVLFVGRLNFDKGIQVAADAATHAGIRLVVCGQGTPPDGVDYRGLVGVKERGELMRHAKALICPTLYLEPFGGVAVEAQLCGTPVICTDWGGFTETVVDGETGCRCHTLGEFVDAIQHVQWLDRDVIAHRARHLYSLEPVSRQYESYFERLSLLWGDGWNTVAPKVEEFAWP